MRVGYCAGDGWHQQNTGDRLWSSWPSAFCKPQEIAPAV